MIIIITITTTTAIVIVVIIIIMISVCTKLIAKMQCIKWHNIFNLICASKKSPDG